MTLAHSHASSKSSDSPQVEQSALERSPQARRLSQDSSGDETAVDPVKLLVSELHSLERLIVRSMSSAGRLVVAAAEAQTHQRLSATAGVEIYNHISGSQTFLAESLAEISLAHRRLEAIGRKLGYDVTAFGESKPM